MSGGARTGGRLDWGRDGADWPLRDTSRFVDAAGLRWHVQSQGRGPVLLLVHGTGASTHTWRDLAPLLAASFRVVACDLPGHAFTDPLPRAQRSLPGMAAALAALLRALDLRPDMVAGHSAGAAILMQMVLDRAIAPRLLAALNGALLPFHGWAGLVFAPAARLLALNPLVPYFVAWSARDAAAVRRLIAGTGSTLDARGIALYERLVRSPAHVAGALDMMAGWDLDALARRLPQLEAPVLLVSGAQDRTLPAGHAQRVAAALPGARHVALAGLGHLAHEEAPQRIAALLRAGFVADNDGRAAVQA